VRDLQGPINSHLRRPRRAALACLLLSCGGLAVAMTSAGSTRPLARIVEAPPASTDSPEALFRFRARTTNTACRRDALHYRPCRNMVKYSGMRPGRHVFVLRARARGHTVFVRQSWTVVRNARTLAQAPVPAAGVNAAAISRDPNLRSPAPRALVFDDEFDGTTIDTAAWRLYDGPGHAGHGLRRPSALALDGLGNLVITGRMVDGRVVGGGMASMTNFTYGRVEFRVRTEPDPTATMSAVVLTWPQDQWSPEYTENDMYETGPHVDNHSQFATFIHFGRTRRFQKLMTHETDPSRWHTIAMEWYPRLLEIYVDGQLHLSIGDPGVIPDILHHVCVQLDARSDGPLKRPVRMFVDYIRVYQ
jgi:hypothetical protein